MPAATDWFSLRSGLEPARLIAENPIVEAEDEFSPERIMEVFFRETTRAYAMPPLEPAVFRAHGMELVGPPLSPE
jgi:hypothetical protein